MLRTELNDALKEALKDQDKQTLGTVRLILAALKDRDIAARGAGNCDGIPEEEVLDMLQKEPDVRPSASDLYLLRLPGLIAMETEQEEEEKREEPPDITKTKQVAIL